MDYIAGFWFLLIYEALSWPLRLALSPIPMSGDIRRILSRVAGPAIIVLSAWLFAHTGVPINPFFSLVWYALFFLSAFLICRAQGFQPDWRAVFTPISDRSRFKRELFIELLGLVMFFTFLYYRRLVPDMATHSVNGHGSEKFDNAMFFWSSWHARYLPPEDYWLGGQAMHYYYYGQFFWAWVGRFSLLPAEWIITLALARVVMMTWESSWLLLRAFGARSVSAALGAVLVCWMGNPAALRTATKQFEVYSGYNAVPAEHRGGPFDAKYLKTLRDPNKKWDWGGFAFWEPAHAVIPFNIVEHPIWTSILGDFHAHHLSLPWTLALVAIVMAGPGWLKFRGPAAGRGRETAAASEGYRGPPIIASGRVAAGRAALWFLIFWAFGVSATASNVWAMGLTFVTGLGVFLWRLRWPLWSLIPRGAAVAALGGGLALGLFLTMGTLGDPNRAPDPPKPAPGAVAATPPAQVEHTIMVLPHKLQSKLPDLAWHWGFQAGAMLLGVVAFLSSRWKYWVGNRRSLMGLAACLGAALVFGAAFAILRKSAAGAADEKALRFNENGLPWLVLAALMAPMVLTKRPFYRPIGVIYSLATLALLCGLELVFINDGMAGDYDRYNSYFKNAVPAWGLMTAAAWMCVHRVWFQRRFLMLRVPAIVRGGLRLALLLTLPLLGGLVIFGAPSRVISGHLMSDSGRTVAIRPAPTLNAFNWGENLESYRSDAVLLKWIRDNVPPRERIAEIVTFNDTDHYNYRGRVASLAGHPVPVGWDGHEYTWRTHDFAKPIGVNKNLVRDLYLSPTPPAMLDAARKLGVKWIMFGKNEQEELKGVGKTDLEGPNRVYQNLLQIAEVKAMFGNSDSKVFLFKLREFPDPAAGHER